MSALEAQTVRVELKSVFELIKKDSKKRVHLPYASSKAEIRFKETLSIGGIMELIDIKHDEKGQVFYTRDNYGFETWFEYDEKGNLIHERDSYGYEVMLEYDSDDNVVHTVSIHPNKRTFEFDKDENLIRIIEPEGSERMIEPGDKSWRKTLYKNQKE